jgi:hypothetical protein
LGFFGGVERNRTKIPLLSRIALLVVGCREKVCSSLEYRSLGSPRENGPFRVKGTDLEEVI